MGEINKRIPRGSDYYLEGFINSVSIVPGSNQMMFKRYPQIKEAVGNYASTRTPENYTQLKQAIQEAANIELANRWRVVDTYEAIATDPTLSAVEKDKLSDGAMDIVKKIIPSDTPVQKWGAEGKIDYRNETLADYLKRIDRSKGADKVIAFDNFMQLVHARRGSILSADLDYLFGETNQGAFEALIKEKLDSLAGSPSTQASVPTIKTTQANIPPPNETSQLIQGKRLLEKLGNENGIVQSTVSDNQGKEYTARTPIFKNEAGAGDKLKAIRLYLKRLDPVLYGGVDEDKVFDNVFRATVNPETGDVYMTHGGLGTHWRLLDPALRRRRSARWPALYILTFFVGAGALGWAVDHSPAQLVFFTLIGVSVASGFLIHARARPNRKQRGRRLSLALVGLSLFLGAGVFGRQSFQLEGFFFYVFAGVFGGVVTHYLVANIVGPLLIGRGWCGWGCWIWMVFDYLPFTRSPGRRAGWGWVRVAHFALSLGVVGLLVWVG